MGVTFDCSFEQSFASSASQGARASNPGAPSCKSSVTLCTMNCKCQQGELRPNFQTSFSIPVSSPFMTHDLGGLPVLHPPLRLHRLIHQLMCVTERARVPPPPKRHAAPRPESHLCLLEMSVDKLVRDHIIDHRLDLSGRLGKTHSLQTRLASIDPNLREM